MVSAALTRHLRSNTMAAASACRVGAVASLASPTAALVSVASPRDNSSWKQVTRLLLKCEDSLFTRGYI